MREDTATPQRLADEAMGWLLRLEDDSSLETRTAFLQWCEKSRDHVQAFLEVSVLDRQLDEIDPGHALDLDTLIREIKEAPPENVVALRDTPPPSPAVNPHSARRRRTGFAIAAACAGIALPGAVFHVVNLRAPTYDTRTGEQRSIKLDDGSAVYLNTRSRIQVHYTETARNIELLEGEAYFVVAQDRVRPFKVSTAAATVRALGTQFNVYLESGRTTVAVVEGKVQVADTIALGAGEAAQVSNDGKVVKQTDTDVTRATAWRQRQLDFRRATLAEVATQFNRYNKTQLKIEGQHIAERRINGVFDADAPQQLLDFLAQRDDLRFERHADAVVIREKT